MARELTLPGSHDLDAGGDAPAFGTRRPFGVHAAISLFVLALGAIAKTSDEMSDTGSPLAFPALCLLVLAYAAAQVILVRRYQRELWVINPSVQAALFLHFLPTLSAAGRAVPARGPSRTTARAA